MTATPGAPARCSLSTTSLTSSRRMYALTFFISIRPWGTHGPPCRPTGRCRRAGGNTSREVKNNGVKQVQDGHARGNGQRQRQIDREQGARRLPSIRMSPHSPRQQTGHEDSDQSEHVFHKERDDILAAEKDSRDVPVAQSQAIRERCPDFQLVQPCCCIERERNPGDGNDPAEV